MIEMKKIGLFLSAFLVCFFLSGCDFSTYIQSNVTVFHNLPVDLTGYSFEIVPNQEEQKNDLEFKHYADIISNYLAQKGLVNKELKNSECNYIINIEYGIDSGETHTYSVPRFGQTGVASSSTNFIGNTAYTNYAPTFGQVGSTIGSYKVFTRCLQLTMYKVVESGEKQEIYKGNVISTGSKNQMLPIFPYLVQSLFQDFPGQNGSSKTVQLLFKEP